MSEMTSEKKCHPPRWSEGVQLDVAMVMLTHLHIAYLLLHTSETRIQLRDAAPTFYLRGKNV